MRLFKNLFFLSASLLFCSCENINMDATKADYRKPIEVSLNPTAKTYSNEKATYAGIINGGTIEMVFKDQTIFITYSLKNQVHKAAYKVSEFFIRTPIPPAPCTPILEGCPPRLEELQGVFKDGLISLESYPDFFHYLYFSYESGSEMVAKLLDNKDFKVTKTK